MIVHLFSFYIYLVPLCERPVLTAWITVESRCGCSLLSWSFHVRAGGDRAISSLTWKVSAMYEFKCESDGWLFLIVQDTSL